MDNLPQIPGYKIEKKLGQGGMADVYLGVQETLDRKVAIKILVPSLFRDDQFSKRFIKEAQTAARLSHPNIITIHDVGRVEKNYYIVMEYLEESLNDRLKKEGPLVPEEALKITKMIAGALHYAHNKGFIHRDIKSDNIMFRAGGTAVLVDFGIARAIDATTQLTRTGTSIGTPHYMSPEQCRGEKIDGRSDIYSLGIELFELLTGKVPYKAENTAGIILKHIQAPIPKLPKHLDAYQPFIDKMMAKDKAIRIQSGEELIKFIDAFQTAQNFVPPPRPSREIDLPDHPTVVTPRSNASITAAETPVSKKPLVMGILIFFLVVVSGVAIYLITKGSPNQDSVGQVLEEKKETDVKALEQEKKGESITTEPELKKDDSDSQQKIERKPEQGKANNSLNEAEKIKKPSESNQLKAETDQTQRKSLNQKKEIVNPVPKDQKSTQKKPAKVVPPPVKQAKLLDLPLTLRMTFNQKIKRNVINLSKARAKFQVKGRVYTTLSINTKGKITVTSMNTEGLTVFPATIKMNIERGIKFKIESILMPPPKNKAGESVQLYNWRVTFKVGKYKNQVFLTRQQL